MKGLTQSCLQERNNPKHQYMLGAGQLESSFAKSDLGVLVDTKLNKILMVSWRALEGVLPTGQWR